MIGTVGSAEKVNLAKANGYHHVINYREELIVSRVKEITGGKGVDVVYDSVGKDTWLASLDCLKPRGMFASFGQSSGPIEGFTLAHLVSRGSLFATRPTLFAYTASRADLELSSSRLFDAVASGKAKIAINQRFSLEMPPMRTSAWKVDGQMELQYSFPDIMNGIRGLSLIKQSRNFKSDWQRQIFTAA